MAEVSLQSTQPTALLVELLAQARQADLASLASSDPLRLHLLLGALFEYHVRQGGFAQLLYNMNGSFLPEIEDMLIAAETPIAHEHYVQAIHACLRNKAEYARFLASAYTEDNPVKDALHLVSVAYFAKKVAFASEAARFFAKAQQ